MFNNKNFYPTPDDLIDKMLDKLNLRSIKSILDPSAGKGNILDRIKFKTNDKYRYGEVKKFGIEIDNNLKAICKDKGYKILHDDFLTYETYINFSAIVMNPPFDNGDKHLLKAIELQERTGGEIVCILNAETIRNPFSVYRKDLKSKLDKYKAEIEFIQDGFIDAERKTNVDIALVHLSIERQRENSVILEGLKQEEKHEKEVLDNKEIISSDYMTQIIQKYKFEVKAGVKLISEYESIKNLLSRDFTDEAPILKLTIDDSNFRGNSSEVQNEFIKRIRYKYWTTLFQSKEFGKLFTTDLRKQYMEKMEELQEYDFSSYNIETIKLDMQLMLSQSLTNTIHDLFDEFIRYSHWEGYEGNIYLYNGWKTNEAYKINEKKVIMPFSAYDRSGYYYPHIQMVDRLRDIYRVFSYLDNGRTEIDIEIYELLKNAKEENETKKIDCGYFNVTFYKKGTTHFEWQDKDLIRKLNIEGARGRNWIPPSYGKKSYKDMSKEEQAVINDFQGKEEYKEVVKDKEFYLYKSTNLLQLGGS